MYRLVLQIRGYHPEESEMVDSYPTLAEAVEVACEENKRFHRYGATASVAVLCPDGSRLAGLDLLHANGSRSFFPTPDDAAALDCPSCGCQQFAVDYTNHGPAVRLNCENCHVSVATAPVFNAHDPDQIAIRLWPTLKAGSSVNSRW